MPRINVANAPKDVKCYWIHKDKEAEFIEFCRDGVRDAAGNHIVEINPATGLLEPVDGVLRWLVRKGQDLSRVDFYTCNVPGSLVLFAVVTDPDPNPPEMDWDPIPRIKNFLQMHPPTELEFHKRILTIP